VRSLLFCWEWSGAVDLWRNDCVHVLLQGCGIFVWRGPEFAVRLRSRSSRCGRGREWGRWLGGELRATNTPASDPKGFADATRLRFPVPQGFSFALTERIVLAFAEGFIIAIGFPFFLT
jgi:hypothetical protein